MSAERQICLKKDDLIDGIAEERGTGQRDGFFRATFRLEEEIYIEVPEDSIEAECLRHGLSGKLGKRVVLLVTDDAEKPYRIALKRTIGGHESE